MTTTLTTLTTATPREIDARIAKLHDQITAVSAKIAYATNRVLDHAGLRTYVSATWETRKSSHKVTGTFEDGVDLLRAYNTAMEAWRAAGYPEGGCPKRLSDYAGGVDVDATVAERDAALATRFALWTEANELEAEYRRRPWPRYFFVVSSAGHIHSTAGGCNTCRRTTAYGWMPERSGQTEAEALADLGPHAEALCSVCFPSAPVAGKAKVTAARAAKLSAATFVAEAA
jgi:hypothetical protein